MIGYALLKDEAASQSVAQGRVGRAVLRSVVATTAVAGVVAWLCVIGRVPLPLIMADRENFVPNWPVVVGLPVVVTCTTAIVVLWHRRRSILDWYLLVVLCAYLIEIPPHWYPAPARFSTGWYAVRVTGFVASSIVLIVLLYEITALYGALLSAVLGRRREREARMMTGDAVAGAIVHEIRQPLTAMVTSADAGLRFLDRPDPNLAKAKDAFTRIVSDGHRAGEVVASIRANFRSDAGTRSVVDINGLIDEALTLTEAELEENRITVQIEKDATLPSIRGNRVQLQQVLLNLITNSIEAMKSTDEGRLLSIRSESQSGDSVRVSVIDTGPGVGTEAVSRIFAPLYSTKSYGMGIGLPICRAIIEAHEGRLWFIPNVPRGACFQFTLPPNGPITTS